MYWIISGTCCHPISVAAADFLIEYHEFNHAAEVLKSGIRHGLTTDVWAQDALALALKSAPGGGQTLAGHRAMAAFAASSMTLPNGKTQLMLEMNFGGGALFDLVLGWCLGGYVVLKFFWLRRRAAR